MTDKTDQEFIAECEAQIQEMRDRWQCGPDYGKRAFDEDFGMTMSDLSEAVERLKRAWGRILLLEKQMPVGIIVDHAKENAELKTLLRWCRDEIVSDFGATAAQDWGDPEWDHITEILKDA